MSVLQIIFIIVAGISLGAALMAVTTRNLVHAALWLILTLFGVAIFFVLLNAGFLAVAQVVIYIGAISILLIFVIMLTRRVITDIGAQLNANWGWAAVVSLILFAALVWLLSGWSGFRATAPQISGRVDPLTELGQALVSPNAYVIPFEVASILLLAALIGAIIIAWERK